MYISDKREKIKIPDKYAGNAFPEGAYVSDPEALATAEEAFSRGYVFEKTDEYSETAELSDPTYDTYSVLPELDRSSAETPETFSEPAVTSSVHKNEITSENRERGRLSGLFEKLTSENIILLGLILVLWSAESDDELLLMLIILFFC